MSWRSTIKTFEAAARRTQRENERQQRLRQRNHEIAIKESEKTWARSEAKLHAREVNALSDVGRHCSELINWYEQANAEGPPPPPKNNLHTAKALQALKEYKPRLLDHLFGKAIKGLNTLKEAVRLGQEQDDREYQHLLQQHQVMAEDAMHQQRLLAEEVLKGNIQVYEEIMANLGPHKELREVGVTFVLEFKGPQLCEVKIEVGDMSLVPAKMKSFTSTGKLSTQPMPATQRKRIYQNYVCGTLFRLARELGALLPVEFVVCSAFCRVLDTSTGRGEQRCICSAGFRIHEFSSLNFRDIDFSDALPNFHHRMKLSKQSGFSPVNALSLSDFDFSWLSPRFGT